MKKSFRVLIIIGVILLCIICVFLILPTDNKDNNDSNTSTTANTTITTEKEETKKIFEDNYVKVSFVELFDEKSVQGASYLKLLVENKADKNILVSLKNASVNDMTVNTGSGVPMTIPSGKSSQQPFILFTGAAGINSSDEINKVSFKMLILDNDTTSTLEETDEMIIHKN